MSLTEQEVIELAKDAGFLDDDAYVQRYELKKFANALHAKFVESLAPIYQCWIAYEGWHDIDKEDYDALSADDKKRILYQLPDEVK
jgi:hypothetical protein